MLGSIKAFVLFSILCFSVFSDSAATIIRMETVLGDIDIELHQEVAPITVQNFLNYVSDGDYTDTFIHRSVPNFIIQGGSFKLNGNQVENVPIDDPIVNEFSLTNARGTIAMAKLASDPDSATSGWFFNTRDNNTGTANEGNLDLQNGGFTVFGTVVSGMDVVDAIAALNIGPIPGFGSTFGAVPILDGGTIADETTDLVVIQNISVIEQEFQINSGLNGAWYNPETSGSGLLIEIFPSSNLAFMAWFTWDTELPDSELTSVIGNPGQRWLTGLGTINHEDKTITFDLTNTSGGLFDNGLDVENSEAGTVGSMVLSFSDCENATLTYLINDPELINTRSLVRITSENTALCQQLSGSVITQ